MAAAGQDGCAGRGKLLVVSAYFDGHRGGVEIVAGRLARELAEQGFAVEWIATADVLEPAAGTVAKTPIRAANLIERRAGLPMPLPGLKGALCIDRCVRESAVVLIHDTLYVTSIFAFLSARLRRKPIVLVQHLGAASFGRRGLDLVFRLAERLITRPMLRAADQVVFISESVAAHFASAPLRRQAAVSFSGIDLESFRPAASAVEKQDRRTEYGFSGRPVALYVGRFVETKGLETLRRLATMRPDIDFALAGWGPIDPRQWRAANVHVFSGLSGEALGRLYRSADVFVLASPSESFSLVAREALASGLPVVCSEAVLETDAEARPYLAGVRVDRGDPEGATHAFSAAIDEALGLGAPRDGVAFVRRRYDWRRIAGRYASLIDDVRVPPSQRELQVACP